MAEGRLRVPIARVLPLDQTALAHALQEGATVTRTGALDGKIVIEP
jgi:NADPH:quinone reductase-like Zn-dependent oxidoreductase